jgi:predicted RNase H-like HicB family nuclease
MNGSCTATIKRDGDWWIGRVEELPGVNAQEKTKGELLVSLRRILRQAIEFNREEARQSAVADYTGEPISA